MLSKRVLLLLAISVLLPASFALAQVDVVDAEWVDVDNLSIISPSVLNLNGPNPGAIIRADTYATINGYLLTGLNGGAWNGAGIQSTTAAAAGDHGLGLITGDEWNSFHADQFHGITPVATDLLVPYVITGDTNADGLVDDNDLFSLLGPYDPSGAGPAADYFNGDLNFDGIVDDNDLFALLGPYTPAAAAASAGQITAVPEPSTLVLLSIALVASGLALTKKRFA